MDDLDNVVEPQATEETAGDPLLLEEIEENWAALSCDCGGDFL